MPDTTPTDERRDVIFDRAVEYIAARNWADYQPASVHVLDVANLIDQLDRLRAAVERARDDFHFAADRAAEDDDVSSDGALHSRAAAYRLDDILGGAGADHPTT